MNYFEILNALGDGVICVNRQYQIQYCNKTAMDILSIEVDKIMLKDIETVFNVQTVDKGSIIKKLISDVFLRGDQLGLDKESYFINADKKVLYLSASLARVQRDGQEALVIINFREITKMVTLEKEIRKHRDNTTYIMDTLPLGIMSIDEHRRVVHINKYVEDMFDVDCFTSGQSLLGELLRCNNQVNNICGLGKLCDDCELRNQLINDQYDFGRFSKITKEVVHNYSNQLVKKSYDIDLIPISEYNKSYTVLILKDITQQVENDKILLEIKQKEEKLQTLKRHYIYNLGHEMKDQIDLLKTYKTPHDMTYFKLKRMIENLIDLMTLEDKGLTESPTKIMPAVVIKEVFKEAENLYEKVGQPFSLDISSLVGKQVVMDSSSLRKIVGNTLIKVSEDLDEGGVHVKGYFVNQSLIVKVKLISSPHKKFDFDYNSFAMMYVNELLSLLGGDFSYFEKQNLIQLQLPFDDLLEDEVIRKKALLAEDDLIQGLIVKKYLENLDYEVDLTTNGKSCWDSFKQKSYDLVVLDIHMPVMNGIETLKKIKKYAYNVPVIGMTSSSQEDIDDIMTYEFDKLLIKPVDMKSLRLQVSKFESKQLNES